MRLGKQARDDGGSDSDNILGDVLEAAGRRGVPDLRLRTHPHDRAPAVGGFRSPGKAGHSKHPKSALQEWAAGNRRKMPEYRLIAREGPDHAARFNVAVSVNGVGEAAGDRQQQAGG